MPTVMVDIRYCESWWQRNGEAVYCTYEPVTSFASCATLRWELLIKPMRMEALTGLVGG